MNPLLELRETRGQIAADQAWEKPRWLLEDLSPELAQLRDELAKLSKPPAKLQPTAERILREWNTWPTDPKALATAVKNLRSAALGAMQTITEKPAEIDALLSKIESVNPATFTHASVATTAAGYRKDIAPLLGNAQRLEALLDDLERQEQEALSLATTALGAQERNQAEPVAKQRKFSSAILRDDDEPKPPRLPDKGPGVLSGTLR